MKIALILTVILALGSSASFVTAAYLLGGLPAALIAAGLLQTIIGWLIVRGLTNGA